MDLDVGLYVLEQKRNTVALPVLYDRDAQRSRSVRFTVTRQKVRIFRPVSCDIIAFGLRYSAHDVRTVLLHKLYGLPYVRIDNIGRFRADKTHTTNATVPINYYQPRSTSARPTEIIID